MKASSALTIAISVVTFFLGVSFSLILLPLIGIETVNLNWPDIISATVAAAALLLALVTYRNWNKQKIQEDAYSTTKAYISNLVSIEECIIGMSRKFDELLPKPGSLVLNQEYTKNEIRALKQQHVELLTLTGKLINVYDELAFWGASLANKTDHINIYEALDTFLRRSHLLLNCLININFHEISDNTLEAHSKLTFDATQRLFEIFRERKSKKMSTYFKY